MQAQLSLTLDAARNVNAKIKTCVCVWSGGGDHREFTILFNVHVFVAQ